MNFSETIQTRQSVRAYLPREVEEEKLQAILQAVRTAPTAGNFQAYEIYVARKRERIEALTGATFEQKFLAQAPLALVFCANSARCEYQGPEYYALQDTVIATTYAMLAAQDQGLVTCWVAAFLPEKVSQAVGLPAGHKPIAILAVAYPAETPPRTPRRELNEFVHEL